MLHKGKRGGVIRPMTYEDMPRILEIEQNAYEFPWTPGIFNDCLRVGYHAHVYEWNGTINAYGVMSLVVDEAHILNLCVDPGSQGQGLGRKVLKYMLACARQMSAEMALLEVRSSNAVAIGLYQAMGFNEIGQRRGYYPAVDGREDALVFAREL